MKEINWIQLAVTIISFLAISYFLFYRSWLTALGKEVAKLSTRKQLIELEEEVKKDFNEKLELHKNRLNEALALKIESVKSELVKNNLTHQIEYSFLHAKRAKVILKFYHKLQELHSAMMVWTQPMHPIIEDAKEEESQRTIRVNRAINDFKNYYIPNRLFFAEDFCKFIDDLFKEYWDKGWEFGFSKNQMEDTHAGDTYYKFYSKELARISEEVKTTFPDKIAEIEVRFRAMLRVTEELNREEKRI